MTNGLCRDRKTIFIDGYAVQWFHSIFNDTNVFIYVEILNHQYILWLNFKLDYVADEYSVREAAGEAINAAIRRG